MRVASNQDVTNIVVICCNLRNLIWNTGTHYIYVSLIRII